MTAIAPPKGLTLGRTDQGVDFGGSGPVPAPDSGTIKSVGLWNGWPGSGGIVESTPEGDIYVMEDFAPAAGLTVGSHVAKGQALGTATGGPSGIEEGFANATGTAPRVQYNGLPDGTPTAGGIAYRKFITGGGSGGVLDTIGNGLSSVGSTIASPVIDTFNTAKSAGQLAAQVTGFFSWITNGKNALKILLYAVLIIGGALLALYGLSQMLHPVGVNLPRPRVPVPV